MEAMRNAAQLARAGHGQIVAAMAEAGTGKSRLFFEFKAKNQSGWMVLENVFRLARQGKSLFASNRTLLRRGALAQTNGRLGLTCQATELPFATACSPEDAVSCKLLSAAGIPL